MKIFEFLLRNKEVDSSIDLLHSQNKESKTNNSTRIADH